MPLYELQMYIYKGASLWGICDIMRHTCLFMGAYVFLQAKNTHFEAKCASFFRHNCLFVRHNCLFERHNCLFVRHNCLFLRYKRFFLKVELRQCCREILIYALPRHILSKNLWCKAHPQLVTACWGVF